MTTTQKPRLGNRNAAKPDRERRFPLPLRGNSERGGKSAQQTQQAMQTPEITPEQLNAALRVTTAIGQAIHKSGSIPSGHLYATVMPLMDLDTFEGAVRLLVRAGMVRKEATGLLVWIA